MSPHKIDVLPSPLALASYGISANGFLPAHPPLRKLSSVYYQSWENILDHLPALVKIGQLRQRVDDLPTLDTSHLTSEREWQRAYSMLAVLAQAYVWQGPEPSECLPPAITVPFLQTAEHLEVHPVATYAALNLWNWTPTNPAADQCQPDNMVAQHTITGTDDESWFFVISNAMEARAGPIISRMLSAMEAVEHNDTAAVTSALQYLRDSIIDIGKLLERMDERCRPQIFYHDIRPYLAGSMNMEAAGLPHGVFYDEGNGKGTWRKYRGGSNGQSSLLQFLDAVLGVKHERCGGFHSEMREYMPGPHARFLNDIEAIVNIRGYVDGHSKDLELFTAYNEAVTSLSAFRDKHIQMVTRYIILPSRMRKPQQESGMPGRKDLATSTTQLVSGKHSDGELVGTGGTKLIPFLGTSRNETREAAVTR